MALDPAIADQLTLTQLGSHQQSMGALNVVGANLVQGLGVVNTTLIQQHGGVADDAAQYGSMNTAAGVPQSGYQKGGA